MEDYPLFYIMYYSELAFINSFVLTGEALHDTIICPHLLLLCKMCSTSKDRIGSLGNHNFSSSGDQMAKGLYCSFSAVLGLLLHSVLKYSGGGGDHFLSL